MTWSDWTWLTILVSGGLVELYALFSRAAGDTLSEHVWKWLKVADPRPTLPFIGLRVLMAVACVWLAGHFAMGWWTF